MEQAIFAAGCFWGVQFYFDQIPGVKVTSAGYIGGSLEDPTYEDVCYKNTGHAEAVHVQFDSSVIGFEDLCRHFFRLHDPTQLNRQGPDVGDQYRSAIFVVTDKQKGIAEQIRDELADSFTAPIVTTIEKAGPFYRAEDYHQKFAERTGRGMCHVPYEPLAA